MPANLFSFAKFNERRQARYLQALRDGCTYGEAAKRAGVDRSFMWAYRKANPEFEKKVEEAQADASDKVEESLYDTALRGNLGAQIFWLLNRAGDRWRDKRNVAPVNINVTELNDAIERQLARLAAGSQDKATGEAEAHKRNGQSKGVGT